MSLKLLKDIADIFSGHTVRARVENDMEGDLFAIQLKDLTNRYSQIKDYPHKLKSIDVPENQVLQKGDLLFISKGANNYAMVFNKDYPAVAVAAFFVLRLKVKTVNPHYLAWYINQDKAQAYLRTGKEGTMITNISKGTLEKLAIEVPSKENQNIIAEINAFLLQEINLTETLLKKKSQLIATKLLALSHGKI